MLSVHDRRRVLTIRTERVAHALSISVTDTGIGLPEGFTSRMFDSLFTTKAGGMGLGLTICRSIVEAHGGKIIALAPPDGLGSCFSFSLPVKRNARNAG